MKKLLIILFFITGIAYGQTLTANARLQDVSDSCQAYLDSAKAHISDSLSGVSIGNADSLGSSPASDYLLKSDSTIYATQSDLDSVSTGSLSDSITAHRTEIDALNDSTTAQRTDIDAINTLADNKIYLGNGSNVATEVTLSGDVTSGNDGTMAIASGVIVNADVNSSADIDASKIGTGVVSNTEFNYLNGVTSAIQTQIDNLSDPITDSLADGKIYVGGADGLPAEQTISGDVAITNTGVASIQSGVIVDADINASAAITATKLGAGTVDNTELGYLNGVTSAIQTQLTTNAGNISTNSSDISTNSDSVIAQRSDIDDNTTDIATNASNISTNSTNISAQSDSLTDQRTDIDANTTNISTNTTDIDALEALANGKIYIGNGSNVATEVTPSGDVTISNDGTTALVAGQIVDADINASAAITATKIADGSVSSAEFQRLDGLTEDISTTFSEHSDSNTAQRTDIDAINTLADGKIYVGNGSNSATEVTLSGDATITNAGVVAIASDVIVNADINSSAAIDASKIADGSVSSTEFQRLDGLTSDIQTTFNSLNVTDTIKARDASKSWNILSPQSSEELLLDKIANSLTVDSVTAVLIGSSTPSVTFNLYHNGTAMFSSSQTCNDYSSTTINITSNDVYSTFADATVNDDAYIHIELGTVSGTVNQMFVTIHYKETE